jgi:hypothetical protein
MRLFCAQRAPLGRGEWVARGRTGGGGRPLLRDSGSRPFVMQTVATSWPAARRFTKHAYILGMSACGLFAVAAVYPSSWLPAASHAACIGGCPAASRSEPGQLIQDLFLFWMRVGDVPVMTGCGIPPRSRCDVCVAQCALVQLAEMSRLHPTAFVSSW